MSESSPTGKPGKYQRSASGLVVSLVVTVLALLALLWVLALFRDPPEIRPDEVDYLAGVAAAQRGELRPVYPAELPKDWTATGVDLDTPDRPGFGIRLLTDDGRFVGIRQEDSSVGSLLSRYVDEETDEIADYRTPDSVARRWAGYTDAGGDTAYAAEVGGQVVLVYGSAPAEDLRVVVDALTRARVAE